MEINDYYDYFVVSYEHALHPITKQYDNYEEALKDFYPALLYGCFSTGKQGDILKRCFGKI